MNVPLVDSSTYVRPLHNVDEGPRGASDDEIVRLLGATFARSPLGSEELRDARVVSFVLDVNGRVSRNSAGSIDGTAASIADDRFQSITGLSARRVDRAIARLLEAQVLERSTDDPPRWFRLSSAVMRPAGPDEHVDWPVVLGRLAGHAPAILLLRSVLDLVVVPWEWTRLTYDRLASRASYSIGMAQRGVAQLLDLEVLERAGHAGRGHDYRFRPWTLGRGPAPHVEASELQVRDVARNTPGAAAGKLPATPDVSADTSTSTMAVEIGGLILRVPVGTEIRMSMDPDGEMRYQIGSELKITRRG